MTIDFTAVHNEIREILEAHDTPKLTVIPGNPLQLPPDGSPFACYWYEGREAPDEGNMTLGQRMNTYRYQVALFWHRPVETAEQEDFQVVVAECDRALRAAFWGDYKIGGTATRINVSDSDVSPDAWFPLQARAGGAPLRMYYTLEFTLMVTDLEGEALDA